MKLEITKHAIDKYMSITGCKSRRKAEHKLKDFFKKSTEVDLPAGYNIVRTINNGFYTARYFKFDRFRFVIANGQMVTCEEWI